MRKTYTLSEKAVKILEDLARKTRLKMSTIVEAGILEMEKIYNEKNSIHSYDFILSCHGYFCK